ncbi:hypothetical protein WISP_55468 [Willisornis vidua]|uniref:Uncharacterized protein n=1 Tax=Willisornis vidua TaxID=1566151 RepID=A0ABQ9DIA8_9PASS|nr:hypothetical protein WISP_55468 [Willisornis vidua]
MKERQTAQKEAIEEASKSRGEPGQRVNQAYNSFALCINRDENNTSSVSQQELWTGCSVHLRCWLYFMVLKKEKKSQNWSDQQEATWRIVYGSVEDFSPPTEVGMERKLLERRKLNGPSAQCKDIFGFYMEGK